jgi:hypothetical protein
MYDDTKTVVKISLLKSGRVETEINGAIWSVSAEKPH